MDISDRELCRPEFTLLVAGARGGKTSFLRLLLDTSDIAPSNSKDDLAALAKFVHTSSGHTPFFRTASLAILTDDTHPLNLTLIDAPSLDFRDEPAAERTIADTLRLIDARFLDGLDDDRRPNDRYVHLCIYFLDPDSILPPDITPLVPRTRAGSFSQPDHEPVILEPPVTSNPLMCRPTLPPQDIQTIRRLSARVNVLPVIARADLLSNERLAAVKLAVRRDLADAGIGFGIFDIDNHPLPHSPEDSKQQLPEQPSSAPTNGYPPPHLNGGSISTASATTPPPPTSPVSPSSIMRLPYALVSPDIYSHSEGVPRVSPPRHELLNQYTPSSHPSAKSTTLRRGKFLRYYRWGNLDVLDPAHCDFLPLRNAIFHHMETLQKYTREYLFEKFRSDYIQLQQQQQQQRPPSRSPLHPPAHPHPHHSPHAISHLTHPITHMGPLGPHPSRPILAIDTQPTSQQHPPQGLHHPQSLPSIGRHPQPVPIPASSRDIMSGVSDGRTPASTTSARAAATLGSSAIAASGDSPIASASAGGRTGTGSTRPGQLGTNKQRSKKITVACNFCRSRKLKCDGGRPACGQCLKRSNPCDYAPQNKRRNTTIRQPRRTDIPGASSSTTTSTRPGGSGPGGGGGEDDDEISTGGDYQRGGESGNEDGRSEVSMSPEVHTMPLSSSSTTVPPPPPGSSVSAPISRRSSNVDKREREAGFVSSSHHSLPPILGRGDDSSSTRGPPPHPSSQQQQPPPPSHLQHHLSEHPSRHLRERDIPPTHSHSSSHGGGGGGGGGPGTGSSSSGGGGNGRFFTDNDLPHIATLSLPERSSPSTPGPMSAPSLPPIRPASEQQAALRKRAATVPGKSGAGGGGHGGSGSGSGSGHSSGRGSGSGPKVVACNSCRARKTKCDGAHPACASCARRQVPCLYVHDMNGNNSKSGDTTSSPGSSTLKKRRASASIHQPPQQQPPPTSSSSSTQQQQQSSRGTAGAAPSSTSSSHTPTRVGIDTSRGGGSFNIKDDDVLSSSRSLSPPSSRMLATPSTAGASSSGGGELLSLDSSSSRHHLLGHHRSYSSFHSNVGGAGTGGSVTGGGRGGAGSDDGGGIIDERDEPRDPREGAPGGVGGVGLVTGGGLMKRESNNIDLKRPLPIEHHHPHSHHHSHHPHHHHHSHYLDRDIDMRSPVDGDGDNSPSRGGGRAVKKMRIDQDLGNGNGIP